MSLSERTRLHVSADVVHRVIDGRAVLVSLSSNWMHELNEVGSRAWALMDGRTMGEIADTIADEFGTGREEALRDLVAFVERLCELRVAEVEAA